MKTIKVKVRCGGTLAILVLAIAFMVCPADFARAAPIGTTFTYQGRLLQSGSPANGSYDLQFKLYDASSGGSQLGSTINLENVNANDGYFTVKLDFGSAFSGSARWLEIGVRAGTSTSSFTTLTPRQELTPSPYAIYSSSGGGGSGSSGWTISGSNIYTNVSGNVGIGTTSPTEKLQVAGNIKVSGAENGIVFPDGTKQTTASTSGSATDANGWIISGTNMYSGVTGNIGIGTIEPDEKLVVQGTIKSDVTSFWTGHSVFGRYCVLRSTGPGPIVPYGDIVPGPREGPTLPREIELESVIGDSYGYLGGRISEQLNPLNPWLTRSYGVGAYGEVTKGDGRGVYGLAADANNVTSYGGYFEARSERGVGVYAEGGPSGLAAELVGNVKIKSKSSGNTVLELGEGLDYAEGFKVSEKGLINPGSVLVIDANNPGQLRLSDTSYDKKVAGIVAGAKGLGSGVRLGSDDFDANVALAGRVYCNVDATEAPIEPGDLLTTSSTPGYAMKAVEYMRAQGAILGKAMEKLEKGQKGQILVLVTLQ